MGCVVQAVNVTCDPETHSALVQSTFKITLLWLECQGIARNAYQRLTGPIKHATPCSARLILSLPLKTVALRQVWRAASSGRATDHAAVTPRQILQNAHFGKPRTGKQRRHSGALARSNLYLHMPAGV